MGQAALSEQGRFAEKRRATASAHVFFMSAFSWKRFLLNSLARSPLTFCAYLARWCTTRASFLRLSNPRRSTAQSQYAPRREAGGRLDAPALEVIQAKTIPLLVQFDVLVLRLRSDATGWTRQAAARGTRPLATTTAAAAAGCGC